MIGGERSRPRGSSLVEVDGSSIEPRLELDWSSIEVDVSYIFVTEENISWQKLC